MVTDCASMACSIDWGIEFIASTDRSLILQPKKRVILALKLNLCNIQRYTPITVDQTVPFQNWKDLNRASEFLVIN